MAFGVTSIGFVQKVFEEVKESLETRIKSALGNTLDFAPQSNAGQLSGIFSEFIGDVWQLAQDVYSAFDPDSATGAALDALCGLTGTVREPATASTVTVTATGTAGTVLTSGRLISVDPTGVRFQTTANATIAAATAWTPSTAYTVGAYRKNSSGPSRMYIVITAGTSAGSGGPTTTASDITDGTVHWRYLGDGDGYVNVEAAAEETGPKVADAFALTNIETPVSGWSNAINLLDADLGTDLESDASLRARRELELKTGGKASVEAIQADVLAVADVAQCTVFENPTDSTVDSIPPHSIEVLVQGGESVDIAKAIFESKAAGIGTYGTSSYAHTDSQGITQDVYFTRVTEVPIWISLTLVTDPNKFPADGAAQVAAAIVAWGDEQKAGKDAVQSRIAAAAFEVDGVLDVTPLLLGTSNPASVDGNISISSRQIAVYDTSRINIAVTEGIP